MPYTVEKYKTGWRVMSEHGRPLSKRPLTKTQANAQRIAVSIHEGIYPAIPRPRVPKSTSVRRSKTKSKRKSSRRSVGRSRK